MTRIEQQILWNQEIIMEALRHLITDDNVERRNLTHYCWLTDKLFTEERDSMKKKTIDLVDLRTELKNGIKRPFVKRDIVYIEDAQTGECIMVCDLKADNERKEVW